MTTEFVGNQRIIVIHAPKVLLYNMPFTKKQIYWLCQIIGWSLWGLLNGIAFFLQSELIVASDLFGALFQVLFYIVSSHYLRSIIKKRRWFSFSPGKLLFFIFIYNLFFGLVHYLALLLVSKALGVLVMSIEMLPINVILGILGPALMYLIWSLIYFTYHYFEQYNTSLKYEAVISDTELNNLRSQLNPHFIFNALNSIRALIGEDPSKSKLAITQLSNILRNSLQVDKKKLVYLQDELGIVEDYLGLEVIRYEERLQVEMLISKKTHKVKIPPLMVQTLVENGIKHGISKLKEGGKIGIMARLEEDFLVIQIRSSGFYDESQTKDMGYGLSNTRKRIDLIYGESAKFSIKNESNQMVLTELVLPKEK